MFSLCFAESFVNAIFAHHYYLINYIATGFLNYYLALFLLIIIIII